MITALLVLGLGLQGDATVTMTEPAAPLKRLTPRLAEACHSNLKVSKAMENDVVCIAVHDVSTKDLLAKVAASTGGEWVEETDGTYLEPDTPAQTKLTESGIAKRAIRIKADLDGFKRESLEHNGPEESNAYRQALSVHERARTRLISSLVEGAGIDRIAAIPLDSRTVWSNSPNGSQLLLNGNISGDLAEYVASHNGVNDAVQAMFAGSGQDASDGYPWQRIKRPVAKVDLAFEVAAYEPGSPEPAIRLQCLFFDQQGRLLTQEGMMFDEGKLSPKVKDQKLSEAQIEIPSDFKALRSYFSLDNARRRPVALEQAFTKLLHPDQFDPLRCPAELLVGMANEEHLQFVGSLPDSAFRWFLPETKISSTSDLVGFLAIDSNVEVVEGNGWLTVSSTKPTTPPIDRSNFAKLTNRVARKTDLDLSDLMALARAGYGPNVGTFLTPWMDAACPAITSLPEIESWKLLAVCSEIDSKMLPAILGGQPVQVASLNSEAKAAFNSLYLGYISPGGNLRFQMLSIDDGGTNDFDYRWEPTEVAPNGLPSGTSISVDPSFEVLLRPAVTPETSIEQQAEMSGSTPVELGLKAAVQHWAADSQGLLSVDYDRERKIFKEIQIGERATYYVMIKLPSGVTLIGHFDVPSIKDPAVYTFKSLPPEIRDLYEGAANTAKQEARDILQHQNDSRTTPP